MKINQKKVDQIVDVMIADSGIKHRKALSEMAGIKPSTFHAAIKNESLRLVDFLRMAELLGYDVTITKREVDQ
ncbi:hypothetical protein [Paenibacillus campinasensis]|uniref:XRE family transcriptional regulator n=1 Tax=Paenibacillus campinasensis TaxID=66347 RepID=A0A268EIC7_9BACL|nr:hypothetical protein [Paenibacillus campinasensis]PAD72862.1 hypothetical protein CHH67_21385 [Paenibacillus campinasensis]